MVNISADNDKIIESSSLSKQTPKMESKIYNVTSREDGVTWGKCFIHTQHKWTNNKKKSISKLVFWIFFNIRAHQRHNAWHVDCISNDKEYMVSFNEYNTMSNNGILFSAILSCHSWIFIRCCAAFYEKSTPPIAIVSQNPFVYGITHWKSKYYLKMPCDFGYF